MGGGIYSGEYVTTPAGTVTGYVDLSFHDGGVLVTGTSVPAGTPPIRIPFSIPSQETDGSIVRIETPAGPVNLRLTLISGM